MRGAWTFFGWVNAGGGILLVCREGGFGTIGFGASWALRLICGITSSDQRRSHAEQCTGLCTFKRVLTFRGWPECFQRSVGAVDCIMVFSR